MTSTLRENAQLQYDAGLSPVIRRTAQGGCCDWCAKLAGTYPYEEVQETGSDVYRRHRACRCKVTYDPGDGRRQDVHTKRWEPMDARQIAENNNMDRMMRTYDDPIREILGAASDSHPEKLNDFLKTLEANGVAVIHREGAMGYQPNPTSGKPGQIVMEKDASISAWIHEMQHFEDDKRSGYKGFRLFIDPQKAMDFEAAAYDKEIDFARDLGYNDIVKRLQALKEKRLSDFR